MVEGLAALEARLVFPPHTNDTELRVMRDFITTPTVQAGVAVLILCVLIAAGFYLVSIFRDYAANDHQGADDMLANLREMHLQGDISDEEFRTIQAKTNLKRDADSSN